MEYTYCIPSIRPYLNRLSSAGLQGALELIPGIVMYKVRYANLSQDTHLCYRVTFLNTELIIQFLITRQFQLSAIINLYCPLLYLWLRYHKIQFPIVNVKSTKMLKLSFVNCFFVPLAVMEFLSYEVKRSPFSSLNFKTFFLSYSSRFSSLDASMKERIE